MTTLDETIMESILTRMLAAPATLVVQATEAAPRRSLEYKVNFKSFGGDNTIIQIVGETAQCSFEESSLHQGVVGAA